MYYWPLFIIRNKNGLLKHKITKLNKYEKSLYGILLPLIISSAALKLIIGNERSKYSTRKTLKSKFN